MGKISDIGQGTHLSISSLAIEFGVTRETASKRLLEAGVKPSGKRKGYPVYRLKDAWPVICGRVMDGAANPDSLRPSERRDHYQAEHLKLRVETEQRELIPRIEVEQEEARLLQIVSLTYETIPDIVERDCGVGSAVVARIEKALDASREALYKKLISEDDDDEVAAR